MLTVNYSFTFFQHIHMHLSKASNTCPADILRQSPVVERKPMHCSTVKTPRCVSVRGQQHPSPDVKGKISVQTLQLSTFWRSTH